MMKYIAVACALIGAISSAPLGAQTIATIPDMSNAPPIYGRWTFASTAGGGEARFLDASSRPQLILTCSRAARQVTVARPASSAAPFLQLWTSSASRNLPASFNPATGLSSAQLPAYDALLDAMALSRGRIAVGASGQSLVALPAWAEIGRLVEECRV